MPELRQNLISGEWVIISTERAKRPEDFVKVKKEKVELPVYKENCPFCPGNEAMTPSENYRVGDEKKWKVRVTYNKFPALSAQGERTRKIDGMYHSMNGVGIHEVIVENPRHNTLTALMSDEEVTDIIRTYKNRFIFIQKDNRVEAVIIFKNHGVSAGTSLEHPHSQLIATPIVPPQVRYRLAQAIHYFDDTGRCIFCDTIDNELKTKARIVLETEYFISFVPYAALSPFHMWIFPKRHMASFIEINEDEIKDMAKNLKTTLAKLYYGLDNPDFNYTIRSIPTCEKGNEYFHWYISLIPRITQTAGFELGSGMFINVALPEKSAEYLRNIKV